MEILLGPGTTDVTSGHSPPESCGETEAGSESVCQRDWTQVYPRGRESAPWRKHRLSSRDLIFALWLLIDTLSKEREFPFICCFLKAVLEKPRPDVEYHEAPFQS